MDGKWAYQFRPFLVLIQGQAGAAAVATLLRLRAPPEIIPLTAAARSNNPAAGADISDGSL